MDPDRFAQISAVNRAQLLDDALNLARADLLDYSTALEITRYLAHEREYVPWKAAINGMTMIGDMLAKTGAFEYYKVYYYNNLNIRIVFILFIIFHSNTCCVYSEPPTWKLVSKKYLEKAY